MHNNLVIINNFIKQQNINLCVTNADLDRINAIIRDDEEIGVNRLDFKATELNRVFNNKSLDEGGRFYHGWWQSIKHKGSLNYRNYITINGSPTVEIDFDSLHLYMLYTISGEENLIDNTTDLYERCLEGYDQSDIELTRKKIKHGFSKMINRNDEYEFGRELQRIKELLLEHHPIIEPYIQSGIGLKLQKYDSDIAEMVMLKLIDQGIPSLPIHDSFIVPINHKDDLTQTMATCYKEYFNASIAPDKSSSITEGETATLPITDNNRDIYSGYLQREQVSST